MKHIIFIIAFCLLFSCQKKEDKKIVSKEIIAEQLQEKLDLNKAIIQTPPAIVSITANIDIEFREPVIPRHLKGSVLDKNPFSFEPEIKGHAKWLSQTILRFIPDKNLPAGKKIDGILHGKVAFGEQKNVNDFRFSFKVAEQEVLSLDGDFVVTPDVNNGVKYTGTISFAQSVIINKIKSDLVFNGPKGKVKLKIQQDKEPNRIKITSAQLFRTEKGKNFTFSLPPKYTANNEEWKKSVFLPGIGVFRVLAHMDMTDPEADQPTYAFRFGDPIKKNIDLSGYVSITPEVAYATKIKGKYLTLQGNFLPGRTYTITITKGFPSAFGTKLPDDYTTNFAFNNIKPEIKWLSEGVYLPTSNTYKLQFKSVNVGKVHISVTEIYPQNIGFFLQKNALLDRSNKSRQDYYSSSEYQELSRVGETIFNKTFEITDNKNKWEKTELDLSPVFTNKKNSVFVVQLRFGSNDLTGPCVNSRGDLKEGDLYYDRDDYYSNPCQGGYYYSRGNLNKLLISSDIGLTVKKADEGIHVFATNLLTARPAGNLQLELFNYQNKSLETKTTDTDGHALFSQRGAYIFGNDPSGIALIKLKHHVWQINNFDVAGASGGQKGTNVFVYTDRGVHRPGDTVHLSAIIRTNRAAPPEKQPVLLKVKNPKGQVVLDTKTNCGFNGHVYFPIHTDIDDPTGNWSAQLSIGDQKFTKALKIETVKPNRLKINIDIPQTIHPPELNLTGTVTSKYLFGAPAANLKTAIKVDLSAKNFTADKFGDYIFNTPLKKFTRRTHTVFEGNLNSQGTYILNYDLPDPTQAPGLIRAILHTTVYEKGGSFTQDTERTTIYPYTAFVGIKDVFQWGSARLGENYSIPIIVVDKDGNPVADHKLKVVVYVNRHHWWWHYDRRDRKDFREMESTYRIGEYTYRSKSTPIKHKITVEDYGRHFVEIINLTSGHQTGLFFYASTWGRAPEGEEKQRNYLQISSDKNVYYTGDNATLSFETPDKGMILFCLEQGNTILHREWKPVQDSTTSFTFPVTDAMVPNCYASISLIQPHNQNTNDLPMRLYGIKTLYVEDLTTRLPLTLSAPEELRPKKPFKISITSQTPQKATYTIAIVDEGLLDLTNFETPAPWEHYFQKIRLAIRTLDNFDEIIGILYPDIDKYFSIGGDEFEEDRKKRLDRSRVRRFIPVVLFHEPISIDPGQTVETSFTMPNYVGSVRIMVIGTSGHSYTSLEKTLPVKQELMILPTIPRVARPGDIFGIPVSIFSMDEKINMVDLSLSLSDNLKISGPKTIKVPFAKPGEKDTLFSVSVGNAVGADTITVKAVSGSFSADYTVHLPITSPNPFYTGVTDATVVRGKPVTLIPEKFGLEGTNSAKIAFSRVPDIQLEKRMTYLIRYPYGCIEQTVSSGFPQLFLPYLLDLKPHQKQAVTDNINATIKKLTRFQIGSGFSYWPISNFSRSRYSNWGTNYAGHFLIEARELGYHIPPDLYDHWLKEARQNAKKVNKKNHRYQTYRLFLLVLAGKPNVGAMNLVRENYLSDLDPLSRKLLAAAYYISGKKDVASQINRSAPTEITTYRELSGTYGSSLRDRAFMTYLCLRMDDLKTAASLMQKVARSFSARGWYSTQETAMALLGIGYYYKKSPFTGGAVKFSVKMGNKKAKEMILAGYQTSIDVNDMWDQKITVSTDASNPLFVTLYEEGIPLEDRIKTDYKGIELTRNFYNENGQPITVDNQLQGKPFWVIYTTKSVYSEPLKTLALSSIFPSGWEIINPRVTATAPPEWVKKHGLSSGDYMDIRDDRVNWFFDLSANGRSSFGIKINPTFKGTYKLPPIVVEAMYSAEFYGHIEGGTVTVK